MSVAYLKSYICDYSTANGRALLRSFRDEAEDSSGFMAAPSVMIMTTIMAVVGLGLHL